MERQNKHVDCIVDKETEVALSANEYTTVLKYNIHYIHTHIYIGIYICQYICLCGYTYKYMHTCMHTCTQARTHAHTHARMHARTHTHSHTHTHTHTHTHRKASGKVLELLFEDGHSLLHTIKTANGMKYNNFSKLPANNNHPLIER